MSSVVHGECTAGSAKLASDLCNSLFFSFLRAICHWISCLLTLAHTNFSVGAENGFFGGQNIHGIVQPWFISDRQKGSHSLLLYSYFFLCMCPSLCTHICALSTSLFWHLPPQIPHSWNKFPYQSELFDCRSQKKKKNEQGLGL